MVFKAVSPTRAHSERGIKSIARTSHVLGGLGEQGGEQSEGDADQQADHPNGQQLEEGAHHAARAHSHPLRLAAGEIQQRVVQTNCHRIWLIA